MIGEQSIELVYLAVIGSVVELWMCMYGQVAKSDHRLMNMFIADGKRSIDACRY